MSAALADTVPDLSSARVLIASGTKDAMAPASDSEQLRASLAKASADVTVHLSDAGHGLVKEDVAAMHEWLNGMR